MAVTWQTDGTISKNTTWSTSGIISKNTTWTLEVTTIGASPQKDYWESVALDWEDIAISWEDYNF
jgi:hypothetical protein